LQGAVRRRDKVPKLAKILAALQAQFPPAPISRTRDCERMLHDWIKRAERSETPFGELDEGKTGDESLRAAVSCVRFEMLVRPFAR